MFEPAIRTRSTTNRPNGLIMLFRVWARAREDGLNPLPAMFESVSARFATPELTAACESYFALTEACLARPLEPAPEQSAVLSRDEAALLDMLRQVPSLVTEGPNPAIPHGLPGALQWAAFAVLRAFASAGEYLLPDPQLPPGKCPFGNESATRIER